MNEEATRVVEEDPEVEWEEQDVYLIGTTMRKKFAQWLAYEGEQTVNVMHLIAEVLQDDRWVGRTIAATRMTIQRDNVLSNRLKEKLDEIAGIKPATVDRVMAQLAPKETAQAAPAPAGTPSALPLSPTTRGHVAQLPSIKEDVAKLGAAVSELTLENKTMKEELTKNHLDVKEFIRNHVVGGGKLGTQTASEFAQRLRNSAEHYRQKRLESEFDFPPRLWDQAWFEEEYPAFPELGTKENGLGGTQEFFDAMMKKLATMCTESRRLPRRREKRQGGRGFQKAIERHLICHCPDVEVYKKVSFATRKPDGTIRLWFRGGSLGILFFVEIKGRAANDFADSELGQLLDMGTDFMTKAQPDREFVYGALTDCTRWQFVKFVRNSHSSTFTGLEYEISPIISGIEGWQRFLDFLCATAEVHGFTNPEIDGVDFNNGEVLGSGGSAVIYHAKYANPDDSGSDEAESAVVKVFRPGHFASCESEMAALKVLEECQWVPRLVTQTGTKMSESGATRSRPQCDRPVLIVRPVGTPLKPLFGGEHATGGLIGQIFLVLKFAHNTARLLHRDIKPHNLYVHDGQLILNDWGSSCFEHQWKSTQWEGTLGYSEPKDSTASPQVADCRAALRTAWVLLYKDEPPIVSFGDESAEFKSQRIEAFWSSRLEGGSTFWKAAWSLSDKPNYDGLAAHFEGCK
eukprot:m.425582 g.425582  ORF g.425582 m.425582 type:complete len:687 (+) comp16859_c0_seq2:1164-3224(+)